MICLFARRRLSAYVDGALATGQTVSLSRHLQRCASCRDEVDGLGHVKALLQRSAIRVVEPDWTGFWPGIVRGIQDGAVFRPVHVASRWRRRWAMGGVAAAAVATLTMIVAYPGLVPDGSDDPVLITAADTQYPGGTMVYHTPEKMAVVWVFDD